MVSVLFCLKMVSLIVEATASLLIVLLCIHQPPIKSSSIAAATDAVLINMFTTRGLAFLFSSTNALAFIASNVCCNLFCVSFSVAVSLKEIHSLSVK